MYGVNGPLLAMTGVGALQAVAGLATVLAFASRARLPYGTLPPVTILKPVCGDEPLLEQAITSFCLQDYPRYQLVIGAQDPCDPALTVARRVRARFPACDIAIVVDSRLHGANRKIGNLINMLPCAKHDVLVIADSDLHVRPDYLAQVVTTLEQPGTGLVTTIGAGEPAADGIASQIGAMHLSHMFLPSALIAAAVGRQDCLGGTMALRRETLTRIGGLGALVDHLADDNVLGNLVRRAGLAVLIAPTLPVVTVQERTLGALWLHEQRWSRTIRVLAPIAHAGTVVQYPLFWALLWVLLSGGALAAVLCLACTWILRAGVTRAIDTALRSLRARPAPPLPFWLLPVRDVLSVAHVVASFWDDVVVWRGQTMHADAGTKREFTEMVIVEDETLAA
jgi:ceramide glucosyltransferase